MSVREYIGARYVPIFIGEWDNSVSYEPLSIVTNNGISYTSRQFVPIGIDIDNEIYWAETGNFNAQIEQYRQEVLNYADLVESVKDNSIITVEDYGAIGDGITDSTEAIQKAIAENPNSTILFKGGKYIISDTIYVWGNLGGQYIDFGGAEIRWNGASNKRMFDICATYHLQPGDYLYPYVSITNNYESACRFCNGTFWPGDYGIRNAAHHTIIDNLKIMGASKIALEIGDEENPISMQCRVTDVLIMKSNSNTYWSEESEVFSYPLNNSPCGIVCNSADNNFDDINVNRYPVSVIIKSGGQTFENCHFTCQYKAPRMTMANSAAIVFDLNTPTSRYTNIFDTCYFDNHKYCFWSGVVISQVVIVSDGFYFNSGRQIDESVTRYESYMAKYIPYLSVNGFNVVPSTRNAFIPAKLLLSGNNYQALALCNEKYIKNIYGLTEHVFYTANQKAIAGEWVNVIRPANTLDQNKTQCIGCICLNGSEISRFFAIRFKVSDRSYLYFEGLLRYSGSSFVFTDTIVHGSSLDRYSLWFGAVESIQVEDNNVLMIPIYIHANRALSQTPIYICVDSDNIPETVFFNAGPVQDHNSSSYVLQYDFEAN